MSVPSKIDSDPEQRPSDFDVFAKYDFNRHVFDTSELVINRKEKILDALQENQVIMVGGFTGCGKTLQVPQFILDEAQQTGTPCRIEDMVIALGYPKFSMEGLEEPKVHRDCFEICIKTIKTFDKLEDEEVSKCVHRMNIKSGYAFDCLEETIVIGQSHLVTSTQTTPTASEKSSNARALDVDSTTESNGETSLSIAADSGHYEVVEFLIDRKAHIEHRDKKGYASLIIAADGGHEKVKDRLLKNGADIGAELEHTKDTVSSLACTKARYEVVELLLKRWANKEQRNVSDYTPSSLAASGGYVNIIKLLLTHEAEINSRTGSKLDTSPRMLAAMHGNTAVVQLLLDTGSDINAQIETNKNTALTLACFQGSHEVVQLLLERNANLEHRAKIGLTPLMEAANGGYVEVGKILIGKGAGRGVHRMEIKRGAVLVFLPGLLEIESSLESGDEKNWSRKYFVQITSLREMKVLIDELHKRLASCGIDFSTGKHSRPEQNLMLKVVIAGGFYPNYFSRLRPDEREYSKDISRDLLGMERFSSVMFQGFPSEQPMNLYKKIIAARLAYDNCIPFLTFQGTKMVVTFDSRGNSIGPHSRAVYRMIKWKYLRNIISFKIWPRDVALEKLEQKQEELAKIKPASWPPQVAMPGLKTSRVQAFVTHLENPSEFFVVMKKDEVPRQELIGLLKQHEKTFNKIRHEYCVPGHFCVAKLKGKWMRARVDADKTQQGNRRLALVYFVDLGQSMWLPFESVHEVGDDLLKLNVNVEPPAMGVKCRLAKTSASVRSACVWSPEAISEFDKFLGESHIVLEIYSVVQAVMNVFIKKTGADDEETIKEILMKKKLADYIEETDPSQKNNEICWNIRTEGRDDIFECYSGLETKQGICQLPERMVDTLVGTSESLNTVALRGPFTPLEMHFNSLCHSAHLKQVVTESNSVNSVMLDQNSDRPTAYLMVSSFVSIAARSGHIMARETSLMPAIPSLCGFLAMLFCPKVELRVDDDYTHYTGCVTRLGVNPAKPKGDHDMEIVFDAHVDIKDISTINSIRSSLNNILSQERMDKSALLGKRNSMRKVSIFLKKLTGKTITIEVDLSKTVEMLKMKIQNKEGVPSFQQCLAYGKTLLKDTHIIDDYKIKNGDSVWLLLSLKGGGNDKQEQPGVINLIVPRITLTSNPRVPRSPLPPAVIEDNEHVENEDPPEPTPVYQVVGDQARQDEASSRREAERPATSRRCVPLPQENSIIQGPHKSDNSIDKSTKIKQIEDDIREAKDKTKLLKHLRGASSRSSTVSSSGESSVSTLSLKLKLGMPLFCWICNARLLDEDPHVVENKLYCAVHLKMRFRPDVARHQYDYLLATKEHLNRIIWAEIFSDVLWYWARTSSGLEGWIKHYAGIDDRLVQSYRIRMGNEGIATQYKVAAILNKRQGADKFEYLLQWEGYSSKFNSWEPQENLGCEDLLAKFDETWDKNQYRKSKIGGRGASNARRRRTVAVPTEPENDCSVKKLKKDAGIQETSDDGIEIMSIQRPNVSFGERDEAEAESEEDVVPNYDDDSDQSDKLWPSFLNQLKPNNFDWTNITSRVHEFKSDRPMLCTSRKRNYIACLPNDTCVVNGICNNHDFSQFLFLKSKEFPGKGTGVIATREIKKGQFIVPYTGHVMPSSDFWKMCDGKRLSGIASYAFAYEQTDWVIDGKEESGYAKLINHQCPRKGPREKHANTRCDLWLFGNVPVHCIFAAKKISVNEELTLNYFGSEKPTHHQSFMNMIKRCLCYNCELRRVCNICKQKFRHESNVIEHKIRHHKLATIRCPKCPKFKCFFKSDLKQHNNRKHSHKS